MTWLNLYCPHVIVAFTSTSSALILELLSSLISSVDCSPAHWMNSETEYCDTRTALYLGVVVSGPVPETGSKVQSKPGALCALGAEGAVGAAGAVGPFWGDGEQRSNGQEEEEAGEEEED